MLSKEGIELMKECLKELYKKLSKRNLLSKQSVKAALKYIEQLETELKEVTTQRNELATKLSDKEDDKQKLIEKLEKDKMEQFDDYTIYLIESYLEIMKGKE